MTIENNPNQYGAPPPTTQTNTMAIISLIVSILIPFFGGIIGLILGIMARNQIKASNGQQTGNGLALAGIIIGILNFVGFCLCILISFVLPLLMAGTMSN